jgi:SAM-dependent methyltransferase
MVALKRWSFVLEHPVLYRLWQAPFARAKFAPILRHNDLARVRRVLDVGCGPGTNTPLFRDQPYVGLDFNLRYIEQARRRFVARGEFIHADARTYVAPPEARFDFILLNSLLHHIDTENVTRILRQLSGQLTADGHIHILELVLPPTASLARYLALADRGDYPRPLHDWSALFSRVFEPVVCEPYRVGWFGCAFWNMVYFKGKAKV